MKQFDWTRLFTKPLKVYTQLVFWIIVFLLYILLKEYPQRMTGLTLLCLVLQETMELAIPSYSQNLLILPVFKRRRWLLGIALYAIQLAVLITLLPYVLNAVGWVFGGLFHITDLVDWRKEHVAFSTVAFTVISSCVKIALDRLILDKERKENELRHLKAQLNPHFLFNTLNNLYGLAVTESKTLPDLMLKLSDLLRYSLYDTNQDYVPLQKEMDYIGNYVELERIRLSSKVDIRLSVEGGLAGFSIAPLLLIVFIENAFKHFSAARGQQAFVHIALLIAEGKLGLHIKNSVDPTYVPAPNGKKKGGLGLQNARQRLELIYAGRYQLNINKLPDSFATDLEIELL